MNESSFRILLLRFALLPILCLCLLVAVISFQVHRIDTQRAETSQATLILLQNDKLLNSMVDSETGVRGFAATNNPVFLQPYRDATARLGGELDEFQHLASSQGELETQVASVRAGFQELEAIDREIIDATPEQRRDEAALLRQKQAMDSLRVKIGQLNSQETGLREEGRKKLSGMYAALPISAWIGGLLVAALLVWDGLAQFRRLSKAFREQLSEVELQRNYLHTTIKSIGDAVIVCDENGAITLMNPTAESVTGWTNEQAARRHLDDVFVIQNETTRETVESPVAKVLRSGQVVGLANHTVLICKDGSELAIDDSGAPIRNDEGKIVGVVLVFRDIQERRKAERELTLRNAEMESLLANSPAGFATFDREYRFVRVNHALSQIDGVPELDHMGKALSDVVPHSSGTFEAIIDSVFRDGVMVQREFGGQTEREPGMERQWLTWFYPVSIGDSKAPVLVGAIVLDTTDRWHAQLALVRTEKLAAVGRLAASIAHEMNNPLSAVTNLLYLISCDDALNETTRGFVDRASIELDRVSKIATQTLRFARRTVSPADVNVEEMVNGLMLIFGGRLTQNHISVKVRKRNISTFHGYASEVLQLLTNLLSNAIDAVDGSGRITIAIQNGYDWRTQTPCVAVSIADSGPGVLEQYRKKIWEPFFTTKAETGTGLGLWLVEETARKNGGTIRMRTATGVTRHGTVFRLLLPLRLPAGVEANATLDRD